VFLVMLGQPHITKRTDDVVAGASSTGPFGSWHYHMLAKCVA